MKRGGAGGSARVEWTDRARGIGIVLVVVGHVLGGLRAGSVVADSAAVGFAVDWIYAFHMPLFFFLSGLFAAAGDRVALPAFVAAKLRTIAYPYFLWSVLQTLLHAAAPGTNQHAGIADLLHLLDAPVMQFWFLHVLFCISVLFALGRRAGLGRGPLLAMSMALYAGGRVGDLGGWGIPYSVAAHFVYFALGAFTAPRLAAAVESSTTATLGAALSGFVLLAAAVAVGAQRSPWLAPLLAGAGIGATVLLARVIGTPANGGFLAVLGRHSLQIYVAHTIAAAGCRVVLQRGVGVGDPGLHVVAGVVAGLLAPLLLAHACERLGWRYAFTWPAPLAAASRG